MHRIRNFLARNWGVFVLVPLALALTYALGDGHSLVTLPDGTVLPLSIAATIGANVVTLLDIAKTLAPDGSMDEPVDALAQKNEALEDISWQQGNLPTGHQATVVTGYPPVTWRLFNQGVPPTKATTAQLTVQAARMESWVEIDEALLEIQNDPAKYRAFQVRMHRESQGQEFAQTMFYGNQTASPEEFNGLAQYYASLTAPNGGNIISAGGAGSDNTSIWLINWSNTGVYGIYPKNTRAGIEHNDLGMKQVIESTAGVGGNRLIGSRDQVIWRCGVVVADWTHAVRIANIDVSNLVADTAGASVKLIEYMSRAIDRIGATSGKLAFYTNRTVQSILRVQSLNKSTNAVTIEQALNQFGQQKPGGQMYFLGIPVRKVDQLLETEAVVA